MKHLIQGAVFLILLAIGVSMLKQEVIPLIPYVVGFALLYLGGKVLYNRRRRW